MNKALVPLLLFLLACASGAPEDDLLGRELFKEVLLEAQLVEARTSHDLLVQHDVPVDRYYDDLFAGKGVTRERFERTYVHYLERPEELRLIYEEVATELERRRDEDMGRPEPASP